MKRILFVDDDPKRHESFVSRFSSPDREIVQAWNFTEAVMALRGDRFDLVMLDHDLNDFNRDSVFQDMYGERELTGYDLAVFISRMPENNRPHVIGIHSHNPVGAQRMCGHLKDFGFQVFLQPFE